jgi:hypothetical protein
VIIYQVTISLDDKLLAGGLNDLADTLGAEHTLLPWNGPKRKWLLVWVVPEKIKNRIATKKVTGVGSDRRKWDDYIEQCVLGLEIEQRRH